MTGNASDDRGAVRLPGFVGQRQGERTLRERIVLRGAEQRIERAAFDRRLARLREAVELVPVGGARIGRDDPQPQRFRRAVERLRIAVERSEAAPRLGEDCGRSEEHTSELQSLMRISYAVFCLKKKKHQSK